LNIFLVPPVSGLRPPVGDGFLEIRRLLLERGCSGVHIVEFAGQGRRTGAFSLLNSCHELEALVRPQSEPGPRLLFGACSGALASLWVAARTCIQGVVCWDMPEKYELTEVSVAALERKYGIRMDRDTVFTPVDVQSLIRRCNARLVFASSTKSRTTDRAEQMRLASNARDGVSVELPGTSHFPGHPRESAARLAGLIGETLDHVASTRSSSGASPVVADGELVEARLPIDGR
jgi:hypothetical protein